MPLGTAGWSMRGLACVQFQMQTTWVSDLGAHCAILIEPRGGVDAKRSRTWRLYIFECRSWVFDLGAHCTILIELRGGAALKGPRALQT